MNEKLAEKVGLIKQQPNEDGEVEYLGTRNEWEEYSRREDEEDWVDPFEE